MKLSLSHFIPKSAGQENVYIGPRGMSLSFRKLPIANNLLYWMRGQMDANGWYRSFSSPSPAGREGVCLTKDQGWALLAFTHGGEDTLALDLAQTVYQSPVLLPERKGDAAVDLESSAWFALCTLSALGSGNDYQAQIREIADALILQQREGFVAVPSASGAKVSLSLMAYALWKRLDTPADQDALRELKVRLEQLSPYGKSHLDKEEQSMESLILSSLLLEDSQLLREAEFSLYDSQAGGCRWQDDWRRTSHQAAVMLALAEDELEFLEGRAETLRHMATASLLNGSIPPMDILGANFLDRESQFAYAALLYLGITKHRGLKDLWK